MTTTHNTTSTERSDLRRTLETMGVHLSTTAFERAFARLAMATNQWSPVTDEQIQSIVVDASTGEEVHEGVVESFR